MAEADVYEKLREKISLWPIKIPRTRETMEMLRTLFTEEEAEFLTHFAAPYQEPETLDQIFEKFGPVVSTAIDQIAERTGKPRKRFKQL